MVFPQHPPYPGGGAPSGQMYGFPAPPPKKSPAGLIAAAAAFLALTGGGFLAYHHFAGEGSASSADSSAASPSVESSAVSSKYAAPVIPGFSPQESAYLNHLRESGIRVNTPSLAINDGREACGVLAGGGQMPDAIALVEKYNADMGEIGAILTTVSAVQTLCPQNSPFKPDPAAAAQPLPPGQDGEFIRRLQGVGLTVDNYTDAIGDAQKVCTAMSAPPHPGQFLETAQMVAAANPRANKAAAVFLTVTAMQVYCNPR